MDDRRRDGGTIFTLRTKEQGKHLTLNEHDDDDDDECFKTGHGLHPSSSVTIYVIHDKAASSGHLLNMASPPKLVSAPITTATHPSSRPSCHGMKSHLAELTLRLISSYIYGAPSKARNANVVYIWTYVWQR